MLGGNAIMTKEKVLNLLIKNQNSYISGEEIAKTLEISRNSVWKAIKSLIQDGYKIEATTNKGYMLLPSSDVLSTVGIENYILNKNFDIETHNSVTSTNSLLKAYTLNQECEWKVIVSAHQSEGRGRQGRSFYSPSDTGVYFSVLLRPEISNDKLSFITALAGVCVCHAIKKVTKADAKIKWVNDIFVENKKVCGILSEASFTVENFALDYVILGIGINIYKPKGNFPEEIIETAGFILENELDDIRNKLVACILDELYEKYTDFDEKSILNAYKSLSFVIGKEIYIINDDKKTKAFVLDIDENCSLVVKLENGTVKRLNSGEISTKIIK